MNFELKWVWRGLFFSFLLAITTVFANANNGQSGVQSVKKYGPVKSGETLWTIANKFRPQGVSRLQMMRILHKTNKTSFVRGNINNLKRGAYLVIPIMNAKGQVVQTAAPQPSLAQQAEIILSGQSHQNIGTNMPIHGPFMPNQNAHLQKLQMELSQVTKELQLTRETLHGLQQQNTTLQQTHTQQVQQLTTDLQGAQAQVTASQQKNQQLQQELAAISEQKEVAVSNHTQVLATVTALNSDIKVLKERVVELETLQRLKDNHIVELKKALDHASSVIKEQTAVNLQIHQRMSELETKVAEVTGAPVVATPQLKVLGSSGDSIIAAQSVVPAKIPVKTAQSQASGSSEHKLTPLAAEDTSNLSQLLDNGEGTISPKFWVILVLAILLFIMAYFWRSFTIQRPHI